MTQKRKCRSSVVEFGNGPTRVRVYTTNRKDGYSEFTLVWKKGGRRRVRSLSDMEEARMIAQQITVHRLLDAGVVLRAFEPQMTWWVSSVTQPSCASWRWE